MLIISKTAGEVIRDLAETFAYLITVAAPTAAILAGVLSCLNRLWRTGKLAWLQMVSIGTLIEEEIRVIVPVKKAFETLVLCLLQGCPCSRCHSCTFHADMGWALAASNGVCQKCSFLAELAGENVV